MITKSLQLLLLIEVVILTQENISLKSDFYDASTKTMVWTAQSKSVAIESIDKVVTDVTRLIVDQLFSDNIFQ